MRMINQLHNTLRVWTYFAMIYFAAFLWVLVYANDDTPYTSPSLDDSMEKLPGIWHSCAWTKKRLTSKIRWIANELKRRQAMATRYWEHNASEPNYNNKSHQPTDLQAWEVILAMEILTNKVERSTILDTDSKAIGIDNRCSAYLSGFVEDFEGPLEATNRVMKGFRGTQTANVLKGTAFI